MATQIVTKKLCIRLGRDVQVVVERHHNYGRENVIVCQEPRTPLCLGCFLNETQGFEEADFRGKVHHKHNQTDPYTLALKLSNEIRSHK